MVIESDSRRFIKLAIEAENELFLIENEKFETSKSPRKGKRSRIKFIKSRLIEWICKINSVANTNGKGRDDLSIEVLEAAEKRKKEVKRFKSNNNIGSQSPFSILYTGIMKSFTDLRCLLRKYAENIEVVDPQLKNNLELVEGVVEFENIWSQGKLYLLEDNKFNWFIVLSQYVESLVEKYPDFKRQVEGSNYELFMTIPELVVQGWAFEILKENMDEEGKLNIIEEPKIEIGTNFVNIIQNFWSSVVCVEEGKSSLSADFSSLLISMYNTIQIYQETKDLSIKEIQGIFEKGIIQENLAEILPSPLQNGISLIKSLGIKLQRAKPSEWNELLNICLH